MATAAAINVTLNANTGAFQQQMNNAANATTAFAAKAKTAGGGVSQQLQAAAYAYQDFTSVLANGGKGALGRALGAISNNIGNITAAFGPYGMLIGTIGGALAAQLIPKLFETSTALADVREKMDEAFNRDLKFQVEGQGFSRRLSKMDSKEAFGASEDLAADALDLQTELDARRKKFAAEIGGMMGRSELEKRFDLPGNANPVATRIGRNGINVDFNEGQFIPTQEAANRIEKAREELGELDAKLTRTKDQMKEAFAAGRRQEDLEGIQKHLAAWNEFNDAIKHHEDLLKQLDTNKRLDLQGRVLGRLQSESGSTRAGTSSAEFGSTEAYSAIARATRTGGEGDIKTLIEFVKRLDENEKNNSKKIADEIRKQERPVVVSLN